MAVNKHIYIYIVNSQYFPCIRLNSLSWSNQKLSLICKILLCISTQALSWWFHDTSYILNHSLSWSIQDTFSGSWYKPSTDRFMPLSVSVKRYLELRGLQNFSCSWYIPWADRLVRLFLQLIHTCTARSMPLPVFKPYLELKDARTLFV